MRTWTKESKGLFYLKAPPNELSISHYYLTESRVFAGNANTSAIHFVTEEHASEVGRIYKKFKIHLDPSSNQNSWLTSLSDDLSSSKNLYTAIESEVLDAESRLEEGQIIRFGRQVMRVSKIHRAKGNHVARKGPTSDQIGSLSQIPAQTNRTTQRFTTPNTPDIKTSEQLMCRICLEPETNDNLFEKDMCMCSEHMPAHFTCLVQWLQKKCEQSTKGQVVYYDVERLKCDICKQRYQPIVSFNGQDHNLLDVKPMSDKPAVVFEVYNSLAKEIKGLYFIQFDDKGTNAISIGRTSKSDIRLNDASVSRNHAKIVWHQNELHVIDIKSKFGTCRLVMDKFPLVNAEQKRFVIDKYMVSFHVMQTKKHCACFRKGINFITNPSNPPAHSEEPPVNLSQAQEQPEEEEERHILDPLVHLEPRLNMNEQRIGERRSLRLESNPNLITGANEDQRPTHTVNVDFQQDRSADNLQNRLVDNSRKSVKNTHQNSPSQPKPVIPNRNYVNADMFNHPQRSNFSHANFETNAMTQTNQTDYLMTNFNNPTQKREFASGSDRFQESHKNPNTSIDPPMISRIKPLSLFPDNNIDKENADHNVLRLNWQQHSNPRPNTFDSAPKINMNSSPVGLLGIEARRNVIQEEDDSVEELVFSGKTISNLAFEECDDYEFN